MKHTSFLRVVVLAALVVFVASCGVPMEASGDYYEEAPARSNVYYGAPNTVIVERDPFTGRYYQVSPGLYGSGVYATPAYPYGGRNYSRNRNHNNRNFNSDRTNQSYRRYAQPQQTPAQRQQVEQKREQAKESILGRKRN